MQTFKDHFSRNIDRFIEEWKSFLRFESISAIPEYHGECVNCARWLQAHLKGIGFSEVQLLPTEGQPVVYAHFEGDPAAPRILFYGHYDVFQTNPLVLRRSYVCAWRSG